MFTTLQTSRPLLDLGETLMTGCLLDVGVILILGQTRFISLRENPPFTPFIIVCDAVLGNACYIFNPSLVK